MHAWAVFQQLNEGKIGMSVSPDALEEIIVKDAVDSFSTHLLVPLPYVYHEPGFGKPMSLGPVINVMNKTELWDWLCQKSSCCHVCGEPLQNNHLCFEVQANL